MSGGKQNTSNPQFEHIYAAAKAAFGGGVKQRRKAAGLSQEELALRVGAGQGYISRLEAGTLNPTLETMAELAAVLGITIGDFLNA